MSEPVKNCPYCRSENADIKWKEGGFTGKTKYYRIECHSCGVSFLGCILPKMTTKTTEKNGEELKNCPFCGGEATLCDDDKKWFYIVCGDCGVVTDHVSAEEIAVRIWNTRPEEDRLKAENERLKEWLGKAGDMLEEFSSRYPDEYFEIENSLKTETTEKKDE
ncbi:MAG: Lar family restriction alleviation protein [Lentisphaeria bacterium]|nr:Lar family restriction alleviation protein [Lentisphaeria bacterium]